MSNDEYLSQLTGRKICLGKVVKKYRYSSRSKHVLAITCGEKRSTLSTNIMNWVAEQPETHTFDRLKMMSGIETESQTHRERSHKLVGFKRGLEPSQPVRTWPIIHTKVSQKQSSTSRNERTSVSCVFSVLQLVCQKSQHARRVRIGHIDIVKVICSKIKIKLSVSRWLPAIVHTYTL